ncbi:hypothetical protein CHKEEEPN_2346 [Methylorubrum podarium]|nr:hypothetical protein CHKEEEPN_2346 [Methylorubrum podarium]
MRPLDEAGAPRGGGTGAPVPIADSKGGFAGLTDPRFAGIVVCVGGSAGGCFPVPTAAPRLQAAR